MDTFDLDKFIGLTAADHDAARPHHEEITTYDMEGAADRIRALAKRVDPLQSISDDVRDPARIMYWRDRLLNDTELMQRLGLRIEPIADACRPMPGDWTALQLTYYDNGAVQRGRKRSKLPRTKTQWAVACKVWDRHDINFSLEKQVAWKCNLPLWTADEAVQIVGDMVAERLVTSETLSLLNDAIMEGDWRYSIPLVRNGDVGTQWLSGHIVATIMVDGAPSKALMITPSSQVLVNEMSETTAAGAPLRDKVKRQCRVARLAHLAPWATEICD